MTQLTLTKNDDSIGYTVYFLYEGVLTASVHDTYQDAIEDFKEQASLIGQ